MSKEETAQGGAVEKRDGGKGKLVLPIVLLIALVGGGGYLTYRDLVTPFSPSRVAEGGPDADASAPPEQGAQEAATAQKPETARAPESAAPQATEETTPDRAEEIAAAEPQADAVPSGDTGQSAAVETPAPETEAAAQDAQPAPEVAADEAGTTTAEAAPVQEVAAPAEAAPTQEVAAPAETAPAQEVAAPAEAAPTQEAAAAAEAAPAQDVAAPAEAGPAQDLAALPRTDQDGVGDAVTAPTPETTATTDLPEDETAPSLSLRAVRTPQPDAETAATQPPTFDIIRMDSSGSGLVAGRAAPGSKVQILSGDSVVATVEASEGGEFVAFIQTPAANEGQVLSLAASEGVSAATGSEDVLILPSPEAGDEPTVVKATDDEVRILQPSPLGRVDGVTLDSISYDQGGAVKLAGRAPRAQAIRIYVDGAPKAVTRSSEAGTWDARLETVDAGRYVLRVDALADDGRVESRAESPFQRVYPTAGQAAAPTQITVQPGNTLWVMARDRYGSGILYTQIFAANREAIRDPDLIYPGQIFTLPSESEDPR